MTTPDSDLTPNHFRGVALSITICAIFGAIWGLSGSAALVGGWRWFGVTSVLAVTTVLLLTAQAFRTSASRLASVPGDPSINPFRTKAYRLAVIGEVVAIPVAGRLLTANGYDDAVMPAVAIIVGLHFFGLVPAFRSSLFAWTGGAFCLVGLAALALHARTAIAGVGEDVALRTVVVGFGCALVLWLSVLPIIVKTRQQMKNRHT
jgi:hypothetical protein